MSAAFISYSREDSEFALRLAQDLKAAGANVWLDQLELVPGHAWDNAIEEALLAAPQMLVVLSPTSVRSDNVRDEISYALKQGKTVVPVLYMECVIPLRLERKQHIDFRHDYARGLAHLLKYLDVTNPDASVLRKAAEGDAQRQAAWQAREAEAQRLKELAERDEAERRAGEELRRKQEADARAAEERAIPTPQLVTSPKAGARRFPVWGWASLAAVALIATFVAVWVVAPSVWRAPTATSPPAAEPQPAASQAPARSAAPVAPTGAATKPAPSKADQEARDKAEQQARDQAAAEQQRQQQATAATAAEQLRQQQAAAATAAEQLRQQQAAAATAAEQQRQQQEASLTWTDPLTGLMWTKKDNGFDVNWQQAMNYCQGLQLAGHSDWRLATNEELQGIYDASANVPGHWLNGPWNGQEVTWHVKGNLEVSGWQWSGSQGNASGEAWYFNFVIGRPFLSSPHVGGYTRALCVRRSGG